MVIFPLVEVSIDRYHYYFILFFHEYGSPFSWCGNVSDRVVFAIFSPFEPSRARQGAREPFASHR